MIITTTIVPRTHGKADALLPCSTAPSAEGAPVWSGRSSALFGETDGDEGLAGDDTGMGRPHTTHWVASPALWVSQNTQFQADVIGSS
jgi:hypothetical protein